MNRTRLRGPSRWVGLARTRMLGYQSRASQAMHEYPIVRLLTTREVVRVGVPRLIIVNVDLEAHKSCMHCFPFPLGASSCVLTGACVVRHGQRDGW